MVIELAPAAKDIKVQLSELRRRVTKRDRCEVRRKRVQGGQGLESWPYRLEASVLVAGPLHLARLRLKRRVVQQAEAAQSGKRRRKRDHQPLLKVRSRSRVGQRPGHTSV